MNMPTFHISEAEAAENFIDLLARVRAGEEIVIDSDDRPVVILRAVGPPHRSISESIARAEASSRALGYAPVMDAGFAADMEEIIRSRKPRDTSAWD
ncbi:MAG: hypothetical protein ABI383_09875 [Acidobacteriaceae bacterium]